MWGYNSMPIHECDRKPLYNVEITCGASRITIKALGTSNIIQSVCLVGKAG
jgi:hypothetical protein